MDHLNRKQAPFGPVIWEVIDAAAVGAARERLIGRRFLDVEGPYGPGLTTIEVCNDDYCRQPGADEAGAVAAREEEILYYGQPDFGLAGLLSADGRGRHTAGNWSDLDQVLNDVLAAVTKLDDAGFRGPYALVLAPALYNGLFRRYPGTELLQLEHLRRLCSEGIHKAAIEGGAVIDSRAGVLVVGQDLMAGYAGQDGIHYELYLSESIVLRLDEPKAVCTLEFKKS